MNQRAKILSSSVTSTLAQTRTQPENLYGPDLVSDVPQEQNTSSY